jgi:osmoprotectant transport system substrate-binding protein
MRLRTMIAGLAAATFLLTGCGGDDDAFDSGDAAGGGTGDPTGGSGGTLTIATTSFAEAPIVAEMYRLLLENAGYQGEIQTLQNREIILPALESGEVDIAVEYVATLGTFLTVEEGGEAAAANFPAGDLDAALEETRRLAEPRDIVVLDPAGAVDSNQFFTSQEYSTANGVTTLSNLAGKSIRVAAGEECEQRIDCGVALTQDYGATVTQYLPTGVDTAQTFDAVRSGQADIGLALTTDPQVEAQGFVRLEDDKGVVEQADNIVAAVNEGSVDEGAREALNALAPVLTTEDTLELVERLTVQREQAADIAQDYLTEKGLLE